MPHNQYDQQLSVGDELDLRCRVTQVLEGETQCNVTVEAVNRPDGETYIPTITGNSKFCRKVDPDVCNGTFGQALAALKEGRRVARRGWNGKGMFIYLNKGSAASLPECGSAIEGISSDLFEWGDDGTLTRLPNINMQAATGSVVTGWLASQTDLLAEDWETLD